MEKPEKPQIGMTFSRTLMPQIGSLQGFLRNLDQQIIAHKEVTVDPRDLKSTQSEFNMEKVNQIKSVRGQSGVIISNDNHILDGHHRWLAHHRDGKPLSVVQVDLPILELMRVTKSMPNPILGAVKSVIQESIRHRLSKY